ncbi:MAG: diacylglycerol kinase family lipid kinase [Chloroflexi bacterium]|nr:diacylglycerol kinase family lipid kinase [Chloroflexota bacterium]
MLPGSLLIVRNPRARRAPSEAALREAVEPLRARGVAVELRSTTAPGHAGEIAAEAARDGVELLAAAGGDGTIHEVINGLGGSETALTAIPAGTANVWAREAGIPRNPARALAWIEGARRVRIDLGRAEFTGPDGTPSERVFLLMCSTGLDAEAVRRIGGGGRSKRWLGPVPYALHGSERLLRAPAVRTRIAIEGPSGNTTIERSLLFAVAGNTRLYGGVARLTGGARADDGLLDLAAFCGGSPASRLTLGARVLVRAFGRGLRGSLAPRAGGSADYLRGARIRIEPEMPLAVQADGEYLGETPLTLSVEPRALDVLVAPRPHALLGE